MEQLERKDIYILNRQAVRNLVDSQKGRDKKTRACQFISEKTGLDEQVLYNKVGICNPKTRTVPFFVASGLQVYQEFKDFILDVRRTLILINATGETLFGTNEKIALTIMLLFYDEKEWWTPGDIIDKAKAAGVGEHVLKLSAIKKSLNSKQEHTRNHNLFKEDNDCYSLNIEGIIQYINDPETESVNHKASPILT